MLYFPLPIYYLHACLICIVYVEIVPKTSLKPKRLKNCNFSTKCLITPPPLDTPTSRSYSSQYPVFSFDILSRSDTKNRRVVQSKVVKLSDLLDPSIKSFSCVVLTAG